MSKNRANREYISKSAGQTKRIGEELAKNILKGGPKKRAFVVGLKGDLGGGKTTFLQGFAKGLGIKNKILSPTFVIYKRFSLADRRQKFKNFFHFDCYRIKSYKNLTGLGFGEIISSPENIVAIEWAERIASDLPEGSIILEFEFIEEKTRKIKEWQKKKR